MIRLQDWDSTALGDLDIETVRALYQPFNHFRIQQDRHETHTPFLSSGVARTYFVVSGKMTISDGAAMYTIGAGQYIYLPKGSYTIGYPEIVEHICVLELPELIWEQEKDLYATTFRPRLQKIDQRSR